MNQYSLMFAALLFIQLPSVSLAQQQSGEGIDTDTEPWKDYYRSRAAADYEFAWSVNQLSLELKPNAIVNWTNPLEKGQINGSTFVWEYEGRPVVIGQLFSYLTGAEKRSFCHVFTALTDKPVVGRRKGRDFWTPAVSSKSGWKELKAAGVPAENRQTRLLQMRRIARQFEAYTEEASRGKRILRLLPQPLYRGDEALKETDAGLFAYVVGTDPELMILIDCDLTEDSPTWRYRFAQSTRSTTVATFKNLEVYRYDGVASNPQSPQATYYSRHGVEVIAGEFE